MYKWQIHMMEYFLALHAFITFAWSAVKNDGMVRISPTI